MKKDIVVPAAGESVTEADIAYWSKSSGDYVELDEQLLELETDKASMPLNAEIAGILTVSVEEGETVYVGDVIGYITASDQKPAPAAETAAPAVVPSPDPVAEPQKASAATGHPSPAAAKTLAQAGVSPAAVSGTGKDGRITKQDAVAAAAQPVAQPAAPTPPAPAPAAPKADAKPARKIPDQPVISSGKERTERREKMSRLRRTIAQRLVEVQQNAALLTTFNEIDMTEIMALRKQYKDEFKEKYGVNLGFMSLFTKAAAIALEEFPLVNARVDEDHIVYHDYADIGIAVSTPKGLVVPVVRNADQLTYNQIEASILNYALRGRAGQITPDDMAGGTFTITNGGVFGSMLSTPIVNQPQSAILGMHNIVQRPMAVNGEVKIRPIMYVALSYDHRIIDGAEAVSFLVKIKQLIEEPARLMLSL